MENKYIVLDTETTGLNAAEDELLQVSIIDEEGNVLFDSYIRPTQHTEWAEAEHINHITPEMVADAPIIAEVMPEITDILKRYDKIVGYNVRFDADFLKNNGAEFADNTNFVDSMKIFSLYFSADNKRCKLTEAADYFCYDWSEHKEAHNSLGDCFATLYVYKKLTTDTMTIERVIDGKRVGIELTPAEISQAYCIKEYYDRKQDVLNVLDEMDSLKIGDIDLSKDFLKNSNTFIDDVIYRYEKMDDHLEDYNMAIKDVLDNADKIYSGEKRIEKDKTLVNKEMRELLTAKNFPAYYENGILPLVLAEKKKCNDENIEDFFQKTVGNLDMPKVDKRMQLINDNRLMKSVYLGRIIQEENGEELDGRFVWDEYKQLIEETEMEYSERKVKLHNVRSKMNAFIYQFSCKAEFMEDEQIGELYYIENGEAYFDENDILRRELFEEGKDLFI